MRDTYLDYETRTIANLIPRSDFDPSIDPSRQGSPNSSGWIISRINVPAQYRGQGHGSRMLKRILADADYFLQPLYLDILPSGPLDYAKLKDWYERHGFRERPSGEFKRLPRHDQPYADYRQVPPEVLASEPGSIIHISEHAKEAIKQIASYQMPDTPESPSPNCTHINLTSMSPIEWVGDGEGPEPKIYQCDACHIRYLVIPGQSLVRAIIEDPRQPGDESVPTEPPPEYFKTSVQQAVEQLVAIAKDPDEDAPDRLMAIEMIFKYALDSNN